MCFGRPPEAVLHFLMKRVGALDESSDERRGAVGTIFGRPNASVRPDSKLDTTNEDVDLGADGAEGLTMYFSPVGDRGVPCVVTVIAFSFG